MKNVIASYAFGPFVLGVAILLGTNVDILSAQNREHLSPDEWKWLNDEVVEKCVHGSIESPSMKREIGFNIYLPPAYKADPKKHFPVVYFLHGGGGTEASAKAFTWAVDLAIREKAIGDVIYVFPNGGQYSGYRDRDDGSVMAETWIIKELIPHIDKTYRTIDSRSGRALSGWSMGGGGSLRFMAKYPEMFCAAATMAASIVRGQKDTQDRVAAHVQINVEAIRGKTGLWITVGEADSLFAENVEFSKMLNDLNIDHTFQTVPEVGHKLGEFIKRFHREIVEVLASNYEAAK